MIRAAEGTRPRGLAPTTPRTGPSMALRQQLHLTQRQEMRMNPRLYQAMDLLYLPLLELEQHLKQELVQNPFLEMTEPEEEFADQAESEEQAEKEEEEVDWEEILLDGFDPGYRTGPTRERPEEVAEKVGETAIDLWDHLLAQLYQNDGYGNGDMRIGEEIIGNIDEDGYLTCSVEEVASTIDVTVEDV